MRCFLGKWAFRVRLPRVLGIHYKFLGNWKISLCLRTMKGVSFHILRTTRALAGILCRCFFFFLLSQVSNELTFWSFVIWPWACSFLVTIQSLQGISLVWSKGQLGGLKGPGFQFDDAVSAGHWVSLPNWTSVFSWTNLKNDLLFVCVYVCACGYMCAGACVPWCICGGEKTTLGNQFFSLTVRSGNQIEAIRFMWQVLLPSAPSHQPPEAVYFHQEGIELHDFLTQKL